MINSAKNGHKPIHRKTTVELGPKTVKNWRREARRFKSRKQAPKNLTRAAYSDNQARARLGDIWPND